jgi:hypothetical protein
MPPTPPGLVPYAGPALQNPYGETLLQMMQQQSDRQYAHAMREAQRSADKWGAGADFIGSLYPAYLQQQERQRSEEDRERAEVDRQRAEQDRLLNRREQEARIREAQRVVAREGREDLRAADERRLASVTNIPLEEQQRLAHGQLESTQFPPVVDEAGQVSLGPGVTTPAEIAAMPELVPMGGGYGLPIGSLVKGEDPVYERARTFEEVNRLDIDRAANAAAVAATAAKAREEAARLTAEHRSQLLEIQREQGQPRLTYSQQSSLTEEALLHSFAAMSRGEDPLFTASDAIGGLAQYGVDGKAFIRGAHEKAVNIRGGEFLRGWLGTEEGRDSMSEHLTLPGADVDNYTAPQEQQERFLSQARLEIPLADFMAGGAPAPETREVGPPPVPNLREIVEDALPQGKWPRQDVPAQVAEFKNTYGLGTIEEAANLYRDVDDAVRSIRESVKQEESGPMTWEESVTARPKPRADESYESYQSRRKREQELGHLSAMAPVDEQNAKLLSEAVNRYFSTLTPTP